MDRIIIALSGASNSGKGWVSSRLCQNHGFEAVRFTAPIERMLIAGLGLTPEHFGPKEKWAGLPEYGGLTPIELKQRLGFVWGRLNIGADCWIPQWRKAIAAAGPRVVVDDIRFANEEAAVRQAGGVIWHVERPSAPPSHKSSHNFSLDHKMVNATTIAALLEKTDRDLEAFLAERAEAC